MLKGMTRLLTNPLVATYLPSSTKKITCHQELLVLLWKCCEYNQVMVFVFVSVTNRGHPNFMYAVIIRHSEDAVFQKFMFYLLKTSDVLEVLVPILFHVNASRNDPGTKIVCS